MPRVILTVILVVVVSSTLAAQPPDPIPGDADRLRPGLIAQYRSLSDPNATLSRIDAKPAFYLGDSSPHPRLPPGPFDVEWNGLIRISEPGRIAFSAFATGELEIDIDGMRVLSNKSAPPSIVAGPGPPIEREPGHYPITIRFRSRRNAATRLQVFWEGPTFAREPVPAWRLMHSPKSELESVTREEQVQRGRAAVDRLGCARCHSNAFPSVDAPPPGPSLADAGQRLTRDWVMHWLADPSEVRRDARMPALFSPDRAGLVERWVIAEYLTVGRRAEELSASGNHRAGRIAFLGLGCATCHFVPDVDSAEQRDPGRSHLVGLGDRYRPEQLVTFLVNPQARYPDGRMPVLPVSADTARNLAAYLLLWSKPSAITPVLSPTSTELQELNRRLQTSDTRASASALLKQKGCMACHPGLGSAEPLSRRLANTGAGCQSDGFLPGFRLDKSTRSAIDAFLKVARLEAHPSPFAARQRKLERAGCIRCHQRDTDRPPPIETIGSTLGGAFLEELPFQRTPRLSHPHQKFTRSHLLNTLRDGVSGLRRDRFTYRMPAFGAAANELLQALAESDGELPGGGDNAEPMVEDPTLGTVHGPSLIGSQGYGCISCHIWNGRQFVTPDPGAAGTDLTRLAGRIRRDWFDRFLEDPQRSHPGTPMPAVFERGKPALLATVLDGNAARQRDALWAYFARGKDAPEPRPAPPVPIAAPRPGEPPLVAQIPIRLPEGGVVESLTMLTSQADLLIYDLATGSLRRALTGARILRTVQGRTRQFLADGTFGGSSDGSTFRLVTGGNRQDPQSRAMLGYDLLPDGFRVRWRVVFAGGTIEINQTLQAQGRVLHQRWNAINVPANGHLELSGMGLAPLAAEFKAVTGELRGVNDKETTQIVRPNAAGAAELQVSYRLPQARLAPSWQEKPIVDPRREDPIPPRPGYRVIAYPRPKTVAGEDRIMPVALAADPRNGRLFVASLKTGELFVLNDPDDSGRAARFDDYGRGLFQDALSMYASNDGLYLLHRRNLTRITDENRDGAADRFERIAALPHGIADTYDYAYGLTRDRAGAFVYSFAPYANAHLPGSGGALRLMPGTDPKEIAFGMRNPLGWCSGPDGEVFFTDNQGEWVATNKLCHVTEGRYYGFPNAAQKQHMTRPPGRTAVWVPYSWARSLNGVTYDSTGGRFGPFAGQFFLAELMFGGAIIRAEVEKVNGEYQGFCIPFWGKGLLGPVCLTFDPKGRLFVGGITEPGWMAQPDRGALFRLEFTGDVPFEMRSIHARPRGFRIEFTREVNRTEAGNPSSYRIEHYRYEYTGAYGSPELDRTPLNVQRVVVSADGKSALVDTDELKAGRVYMIAAPGVRSSRNEALVQPVGAYTMNEIPKSEGK